MAKDGSFVRKSPMLLPGYAPPIVGEIFVVQRQLVDEIDRFCRLVWRLGMHVIDRYNEGDAQATMYVEYGLPPDVLSLLRASCAVAPHLSLMRFDFFLTADGPRLIEISSNPWGLLTYEGAAESRKDEVDAFPAVDMYRKMIAGRTARTVGIWPSFGIFDEVDRLVAALNSSGLVARRLSEQAVNDEVDCVLYDIDTAYFEGTLDPLVGVAGKLLPSPSNEIVKRKSLLPLLYRVASGQNADAFGVSPADSALLARYVVPTHLVPDQVTGPWIGAIKEVVGLWGRQVSILPVGEASRSQRRAFTAAKRQATSARNAILQEYIQPVIEQGELGDEFIEFSLIYCGDTAHPFVRCYSGRPETRRLRGLQLVRIK